MRKLAYSRALVLNESFAGSCTILRIEAVPSEIHSTAATSPTRPRHASTNRSTRARRSERCRADCRDTEKIVKAGSVRGFAGFVTRGNVASQRGAILNERLGDH